MIGTSIIDSLFVVCVGLYKFAQAERNLLMQLIYFWEPRFRPATDISTRFWKRNAFKVKLSHTSSCLPVKMFELCVQVHVW